MNNFCLLMYCNEKYKLFQEKTSRSLIESGIINKSFIKDENDLKQTIFYEEHKKILSVPRGAGYCLWKPYYILETLLLLQDNEILFYLDSGDCIINILEFKEKIDKLIFDKDYLFFDGGFLQKEYTRYDCFYMMNCLNSNYTDRIQLEAGVLFLKNTPFIKNFVKEWLYYCSNYQIISDEQNIYGNNFPEFKDHRHDQSILTNLVEKYKLSSIPMENSVRQDNIKCNYYK